MRGLGSLLLTVLLMSPIRAHAGFEDRPTSQRVGYTVLAGVENVVPITSALAAPRCLPGYIACKFSFAFLSVLVAGEQVMLSGAADLGQTQAILRRGFTGDWILTGAHAAGDVTPDVFPDAPPSSSGSPTP